MDANAKNISLMDMLEARDQRVRKQQIFLEKFRKPLLCFTMNIPGPLKSSPLITRGFHLGLEKIRQQLMRANIPILAEEILQKPTGNEAFLILDADVYSIKQMAVDIEDSSSIGRLFDMDVIDAENGKLSRAALGLPQRTCLICGAPGRYCARNRTHSIYELQNACASILRDALATHDAQIIAEKCILALLYELNTTPKPGLVDRRNCGSHRDMDCFTFARSTVSLFPYFERCAKIGMQTAHLPPTQTFQALRQQGRMAEGEMFAATGGVNTHKGAIFSMGILAGAFGRLPTNHWKAPELVLAEAAAMTAGLTAADFGRQLTGQAASTGEQLYNQFGITGARGQAEAGFPAVLKGLYVLENGLQQGYSLDLAGSSALLTILINNTDTNLIHRSSRAAQLGICKKIKKLLDAHPYPDIKTLESLDDQFIAENLSPGGSADLLALCYLLHFMKKADTHTLSLNFKIGAKTASQ